MAYDFTCPSCRWQGTDPTLDAHLNPWCPKCGKPAEFTEILQMRKRKGPAA